jgi:nucleotide-binding universal stress UspA family protein
MYPPEDTSDLSSLEDILTLAQAEQITAISAHTFAQQAEKGVLKARKVGHTWITTRAALQDYLRVHSRRGRDEDGYLSEDGSVSMSTHAEERRLNRGQVEATPRRLLVAVDGSPESLAACRWAFALARMIDARITLLHVAQPHVMRSTFDSAPQWRDAEDAARIAGEKVIEQATALSGGDLTFASEILFGDPAKTIRRRARELEADLIVIGSRGLGTIKRLLLGSVSSAVSHQAPCSVLVVRERASSPS